MKTIKTNLKYFIMKRLLIVLFFVCPVLTLMAETRFMDQPRRVQNFEGGLKVGFGVPFDAFEGWKPAFNFGEVGAEVRYNFKNTGWDAGLLVLLQNHPWITDTGEHYSEGNCAVMLVGDYNFRQGRKINPYAGLGLGWDINDHLMVAAPRIGVEIVHHIRIETTFYISSRFGSMFMVSAGFAIGGRPKK